MKYRGLVAGARLEADPGQDEVAFLRLHEVDQGLACAVDAHAELTAEHPPRVTRPHADGEHDVLAPYRSAAREDPRDPTALAFKRDHARVLQQNSARVAGVACKLADRCSGIGPSAASLVEHG